MAKSLAWVVDANNIDVDNISLSSLDNFIIRTNEINQFLSTSDQSKYFIISPKGLGKTLILKLKNLQLRAKGYKTLPENRLVEKVDKIDIHFGFNDLRDLETERMWEVIWELSICCWVIKFLGQELPEEISKILGLSTSLSSILKNFLREGTKNIEKLHTKYNDTKIRPIVDNSSKFDSSQIALFVDNIDESLTDYVGEKLKENIEKKYYVSDKVWISAQTSIISISRRLMNANSHLKIFVSIRSEAYNKINNAEKTQIEDQCISLDYSKEEIKEIFIKNIKATSKDRLCLPKETNYIKSFIGFDQIAHRFVKDSDGNPVLEDIFEYIYRHTFGRPREIIFMGYRISEIDPHNRTVSRIHDVVNQVSSKLFEQLTLEIIPSFDLETFTHFCIEVRRNIFNLKAKERIQKYFKESYHQRNEDIISYYWNLGLLGIVKHNGFNNNDLIQSFRDVGQYSFSNKKIPNVEFYLLHPATYSVLDNEAFDKSSYYVLQNIVGYGNKFVMPEIDNNKELFHVHIGLDRDAVSILIPTIHTFKAIAIVLSPSENIWNELSINKVDKFILDVNGEHYNFNIYRDDFPDYKKNRVFRDWIDHKQCTVFITNNFILKNDIVRSASTISFTEYEKIRFFDNIASDINSTNKIVYLCKKTFDRKLNSNIKQLIESKFTNWVFRLVLIDRYTISMSGKTTDNVFTYTVKTEDFPGKQVSIYHNQASISKSDVVHRPQTEEEFYFFVREFELLREGIYQYYKYLVQKDIIIKDCSDCLERLRLFAYMQIESLIGKVEKHILRAVYGIDTKPELRDELMKQCLAHFKRLDELSSTRKDVSGGQTVNVEMLKSQNIFFNDARFYQSVEFSPYYDNPLMINQFRKELKISPLLNKYYTVFISYSFKDSDFAQALAAYLIINGVKVDIFQFDDPGGLFKGIMSDYVNRNDKMLFISSENSLKSEACHFELENCRKKASKSWRDDLIPLMLDKFIIHIEEFQIPEKHRSVFWDNIQFLRGRNIQDFTSYKNNIDNKMLDKDIKNKIFKYLIKNPN